jgi:hypothetical protein
VLHDLLDDGSDIEAALAPSVYKTCAGEWRREENGMWRFWKDPIIMAELLAAGEEIKR